VSVFVIFVTFPFMGRDYDSSLLAAGQVGFGLGATPTAIVNMESVASIFGWSRRAFLIIPIVGAFMIDIANAIILSGFMQILTRSRYVRYEVVVNMGKKTILFVISLGAAIFLTFLLKEPQFTDSQVYVLFLLLFSVGLWVTEAIPPFSVGLFILAFLVFS